MEINKRHLYRITLELSPTGQKFFPSGVSSILIISAILTRVNFSTPIHMQSNKHLAHIIFISQIETDQLWKTDQEATEVNITMRERERESKEQTFPLTIIQQSFLLLCLATSSKVKVLESEAIAASGIQKSSTAQSQIIQKKKRVQ